MGVNGVSLLVALTAGRAGVGRAAAACPVAEPGPTRRAGGRRAAGRHRGRGGAPPDWPPGGGAPGPHRGGRPGRRTRATATTSLADHREVTAQPCRPDRRPRRRGSRGRGAAARLRALAGELHRGRPVQRRRRQRRHRATPSAAIGVPILVGGDRGRARRRTRSSTRASSGDPGTGRRGPLHQAAPGAVRGVHPVARPALQRRNFERARPDPARHGSAAPAPSRCGSPAPWSPTRSASTSRTTTRSPTRCAAGAELLVVQTSNAIFIHTDQIEQQFAISRLRALETGRTSWSPRPTACSGIIAPDGEVVASGPSRGPSACWSRTSLLDDDLRSASGSDRGWAGPPSVAASAGACARVPYRRDALSGAARSCRRRRDDMTSTEEPHDASTDSAAS